MKTKKGYKRVQFDFHKDSVDRLDALIPKTESSTRAEVVRRALRLYEYIIDNNERGYDVFFKKRDGGDEAELFPVMML